MHLFRSVLSLIAATIVTAQQYLSKDSTLSVSQALVAPLTVLATPIYAAVSQLEIATTSVPLAMTTSSAAVPVKVVAIGQTDHIVSGNNSTGTSVVPQHAAAAPAAVLVADPSAAQADAITVPQATIANIADAAAVSAAEVMDIPGVAQTVVTPVAQTAESSQQDMVLQALQKLIADVNAFQAQQQTQTTTSGNAISKREITPNTTGFEVSDDREMDLSVLAAINNSTNLSISSSTLALVNSNTTQTTAVLPFISPLTGLGLNGSSLVVPLSAVLANGSSTSGSSKVVTKRQASMYDVAEAGMDSFRVAALANINNSSMNVNSAQWQPVQNFSDSSGAAAGTTVNTTATTVVTVLKATSGSDKEIAISGLLLVCAFMWLM